MSSIPDGELDRELVVRKTVIENKEGRQWVYETKAKVSTKMLKFKENDREISFQKCSGNQLWIETRHEDIVYKTCSLGHRHEESKKERVYGWWRLDWEHVDSIVEWLNHGSWSEVKGGEPAHVRVLKEIENFLHVVEKTNEHLKPASQKLRTKIRGVLKG